MSVPDYRNLVNRVGSVRVFSLDDVTSDADGNERGFEPPPGDGTDEATSVRELRAHLRAPSASPSVNNASSRCTTTAA